MRKNLTEIVFILDRSGSMSGLEADTIGGFNSMIEKQKKENGEALMIGTENFGAYARKMLIDGYIIVVDYTEQKKLAAEINKIGVNINTVCRRINSTGRFYQDDIDELKEKMDAVWQLLKSKQSEEL